MLTACKGIVRGNTVLVDDEILPYDGYSAVVTILEKAEKTKKLSEKKIDWESFRVSGSERIHNVDAYMKEMRDGDRF